MSLRTGERMKAAPRRVRARIHGIMRPAEAARILDGAIHRMMDERRVDYGAAYQLMIKERPEMIQAYYLVSTTSDDVRRENLRKTLLAKFPDMADRLTPQLIASTLEWIEGKLGNVTWNEIAAHIRTAGRDGK